MIKTTRWKPDTCGCVIEYEWDTEVPQDSRVHTPVLVEPCSQHAGISTTESRFSAVVGDNGLKNEIYNMILENIPTAVEVVNTEGGGTEIRLAGGRKFTFEFDNSRHLTLTLINFTAQEKTAVQTYANQRWPGRVTVV